MCQTHVHISSPCLVGRMMEYKNELANLRNCFVQEFCLACYCQVSLWMWRFIELRSPLFYGTKASSDFTWFLSLFVRIYWHLNMGYMHPECDLCMHGYKNYLMLTRLTPKRSTLLPANAHVACKHLESHHLLLLSSLFKFTCSYTYTLLKYFQN